MKRSIAISTVAVMVGLGSLGAPPAEAGFFEDAAYGLGYAGFNLQGDRNVLSGGGDFLINRSFVGNTLDFGAWDLTMTGPISFSASNGHRLVDTLDLSLRTATNGNRNNAASPLGYVFNFDAGGQSTQVVGNMFIDANLSLNGFGFYDFDLTYSTRQDVLRDGRFTDADSSFDSDFGPIKVSGNIFADVLAAITAPFFDSAGVTNPFAHFSASAKLNEAFAANMDSAFLAALAEGGTTNTIQPVLASVPHTVTAGIGGPQNPAAALVPEPTVLLLMVAALPVIFARRLRRLVLP